jgi:hypothetical protein
VLCVSKILAGVARRVNYQDRTVRIADYFDDGALEPRNVTLSLIGRFEQMEGEQQHFLPIAAETGSGLRIREWVGIFLDEKARVGLTTGFMVLKKDGTPAKAIYFEEALVEKLELIQQNSSGIIPLTINCGRNLG